jgi:choline kinase
VPANKVTEAVVLMAGSGSRLRGLDDAILKPLVPILGRPLISYVLEALACAGMTTIHMVIGYKGEQLRTAIVNLAPPKVELNFVNNPDWQKQNGLSVLAATESVTGPFLLTMSDHLFDNSIVDLLLHNAVLDELNLAIDRKVESIFDSDDSMKVQTQGDRIFEIGKDLTNYDAIDTGFFVCPLNIFDHLDRVKRDGDCSLADGVRSMALEGKARAIEIGNAWWQDIDTPEMLAQAEKHLRARVPLTEPIPKIS